MPKSSGPAADTPARILDVAERFVQTRGFTWFSYADVAAELSVTKASLHYHFRTKAELGRALVARYRDTFVQALENIDAAPLSTPEKLARYVSLYRAVLNDGRMCLCGMVAAEFATLPKPMQEELRRFFTANEAWLAKVIETGARSGELSVRGAPLETARLLVGALEGAMLVARAYRSSDRFDDTARRLLADLCASSDRAAPVPREARGKQRRRQKRASE